MTFPDSVQLVVRRRASGICECSRDTCAHFGHCRVRGTEFHHKKPLSGGGSDDSVNCQLLCKACHLEAHTTADALGQL